MTYNEAIEYLFAKRPSFERQGANGYKPGLGTSLILDKYYGSPHNKYKTIHVAGTNGKGSVSNLIAATLQCQGYKVGLYTSPHFVDFRERIRVNGEMIPEERVCRFVDSFEDSDLECDPSFFELTSTLAFLYFAECNVDYAVIEVGLGGRLDSTNIISPILSVITNISLDHTEFLGNTVEKIAFEKAGIIKKNVPVVIGEADHSVEDVFVSTANGMSSPIYLSYIDNEVVEVNLYNTGLELITKNYGKLSCGLSGLYQVQNANTALVSINILKSIGVNIDNESIYEGFGNVTNLMGFVGRWTKLNDSPKVICDSAHNVGGLETVMNQLRSLKCNKLLVVIGFMGDKDIDEMLKLFPKDAEYYFTQAQSERALKADALAAMAKQYNLNGRNFDNVITAYTTALSDAGPDYIIYIGGSMYVLAEVFSLIHH